MVVIRLTRSHSDGAVDCRIAWANSEAIPLMRAEVPPGEAGGIRLTITPAVKDY